MKKKRSEDEMRDHYDLSGGRKNPYAERFPKAAHAVVIDPAIWSHFGSSQAVNEGLRLLVQMAGVIKRATPRRRPRQAA